MRVNGMKQVGAALLWAAAGVASADSLSLGGVGGFTDGTPSAFGSSAGALTVTQVSVSDASERISWSMTMGQADHLELVRAPFEVGTLGLSALWVDQVLITGGSGAAQAALTVDEAWLNSARSGDAGVQVFVLDHLPTTVALKAVVMAGATDATALLGKTAAIDAYHPTLTSLGAASGNARYESLVNFTYGTSFYVLALYNAGVADTGGVTYDARVGLSVGGNPAAQVVSQMPAASVAPAVPEPATWALGFTGLLAVLAGRRRVSGAR